MREYKKVSAEELRAFVEAYPRPLKVDCMMICDPPRITYNDLQLVCGPKAWLLGLTQEGFRAIQKQTTKSLSSTSRAMTADPTPSPTDAEVEALADWLASFSENTHPGQDAARILRALLATRRSADARVAAAVMAEREALKAEVQRTWPEADDLIDFINERFTGSDPLAALLAEAREAGRAEMREMAASVAEENKLLWASKCDPCAPEDPSRRIYSAKSAAAFLIEMDIRALPVTIRTPEAPRDAE